MTRPVTVVCQRQRVVRAAGDFCDHLVLSAQTVGIDRRKDMIARELLALTGLKSVYERSDVGIRKREGLEFGWIARGLARAHAPASLLLPSGPARVERSLSKRSGPPVLISTTTTGLTWR